MKYKLHIITSISLLSIIVFYFIYRNKLEGTLRHFPKNYFVEDKIEVEIPNIEPGKSIPKIFHRTHKTKEIIELFADVENKIRKLHPNYQIINYDSEDVIKFIKENYNERILKAYLSIDNKYGAAKADFFRYLLIYIKGGIYLDIKSGPVKNIDKLLEKAKDKMIVSRDHPVFGWFWPVLFPYGENIQWAIIAPKGHPVIKELIIQSMTHIEYDYNNEKNFYGNYGTLCLAGPIPYTIITNKKENREKIYYLFLNHNGYLKKHLTDYNQKRKQANKLGASHYTYETKNIISEYKIIK